MLDRHRRRCPNAHHGQPYDAKAPPKKFSYHVDFVAKAPPKKWYDAVIFDDKARRVTTPVGKYDKHWKSFLVHQYEKGYA